MELSEKSFLKSKMATTIPDVDTTLSATKVALMLSGINISDTKRNQLTKSIIGYGLFYFNAFWLHSDISAEIYWLIEGIKSGKNIIELSLVAPCSLISIMATVKAIFLFYGRHKIIEAIQTVKQMHPNFDNVTDDLSPTKRYITEKQIKICKESMKLFKIVSFTTVFVSGIVQVAFSSLPCLSMYLEYRKSGEIVLKLPFLVKYFFDPLVKPVWYFVYFHQVLSTSIVLLNLYGSETLFYSLCTYLQMHFRLLSIQLEHVVESENDNNVEKRLNNVVRKHQNLITLTNKVEELYSNSTLFNILLSSVLICLSGFNVTFNDDPEAVFSYVTFLTLSLSQISMLCYFGDKIMRASVDMSKAVFRSRWYDCNHKCKKMLLLILTRSQKPCKVTAANFADINLSAFTTILSRSWSYFAVLKTMYK